VSDIQHSMASVEGPDQANSDTSKPWTDFLKAGHEGQQTTKEIAADQRWLGEILYGYLARLAHSQGSVESGQFNFVEAIPAGMSNRIGLDDSEGLALLEELAVEFKRWLTKCPGMSFEAGWGIIWVDAANPERFALKRFPKTADEEPKLAALANAASSKALSAGAGSSKRGWLASLLGSEE